MEPKKRNKSDAEIAADKIILQLQDVQCCSSLNVTNEAYEKIVEIIENYGYDMMSDLSLDRFIFP